MLFYFSPFHSSKGPPHSGADLSWHPVHFQWNANGFRNKKAELKEFLVRRGIHVALLQEFKLTQSSKTVVLFPFHPLLSLPLEWMDRDVGEEVAFSF